MIVTYRSFLDGERKIMGVRIENQDHSFMAEPNLRREDGEIVDPYVWESNEYIIVRADMDELKMLSDLKFNIGKAFREKLRKGK